MSWNPDQQQVELFIENHGTQRAPRYRLGAMIRRTTREGQSYFEPLPMATGLTTLEFTAVSFVSPAGTKRGNTATDRDLTRVITSTTFGGRRA